MKKYKIQIAGFGVFVLFLCIVYVLSHSENHDDTRSKTQNLNQSFASKELDNARTATSSPLLLKDKRPSLNDNKKMKIESEIFEELGEVEQKTYIPQSIFRAESLGMTTLVESDKKLDSQIKNLILKENYNKLREIKTDEVRYPKEWQEVSQDVIDEKIRTLKQRLDGNISKDVGYRSRQKMSAKSQIFSNIFECFT